MSDFRFVCVVQTRASSSEKINVGTRTLLSRTHPSDPNELINNISFGFHTYVYIYIRIYAKFRGR